MLGCLPRPSFWRGEQPQQVGATEQVSFLGVLAVPLNKVFIRALMVRVKPSNALFWCMLLPSERKWEDGFEWRVADKVLKYNHLIWVVFVVCFFFNTDM